VKWGRVERKKGTVAEVRKRESAFELKGTKVIVGEAFNGSKRGKKSRKSSKITVGKVFFKKKTK
jgi:hypothetical protein